jgi:hypothetical protein
MVHRTVRCTPDMSDAPATSPGRWDLTVGASDFWARLAVRCTPDMFCRLSGAPSPACLTSARFWRALNAPAGDRWREVAVAPLAHRTCPVRKPRHQGRWVSTVGALSPGPAWMSGGTPDMYCRVSGAPAWACLTSARAGAHSMRLQVAVGAKVFVASLSHRTVRCAQDMSGEL